MDRRRRGAGAGSGSEDIPDRLPLEDPKPRPIPAELAPGCRYPDCSHTHEPGCAVQEALLSGELAPFRFDSYLKILESLEETP